MNGLGLVRVPEHVGVTTKPKVVDFTELDIYPSKYKYHPDGNVSIRSIVIEDVSRQQAVLARLNTTVLIGDRIKVDMKFGHLLDGEWIDLYYKGILQVKSIVPLKATCEIRMLVFRA